MILDEDLINTTVLFEYITITYDKDCLLISGLRKDIGHDTLDDNLLEVLNGVQLILN